VAVDVTVVYKPGHDARELTPIVNSTSWAASAVGGFAEASFDLPGWHDLVYLARVTILHGDVVVWDGRIEDSAWTIQGGDRRTTVTGFGFRRLLEDVSVRRVWSRRDLDWKERSVSALVNSSWVFSFGQFDPTSGSRSGVRIQGRNDRPVAGVEEALVEILFPDGLAPVRLMGTYTEAGSNTGNYTGRVYSSRDDAGHTSFAFGPGDFSHALSPSNANQILLGITTSAAWTPATSDFADFENLRVLGTSVTEDASGGFYGGTLLRDLLALVPGITLGVIEDGTDFLIEQLERSSRGSALSVVEEIASYYAREWGVWENGEFDWRAANYATPDYLIDLNAVISLDLNGTVEDVAKTYYVVYTDAATDSPAEASTEATSQRNPFVKQGRTRDLLVNPGVPMTANTSAQLAARIAGENGAFVTASGQIVLSSNHEIAGISRATALAAHIRPGCTVFVPELPAEDITGGRDGRTLLHVSSVEVDLNAGTVTLSVDSQSRSIDVLLARLAAVTRNVQRNFQ
jgi:hypothetical protein